MRDWRSIARKSLHSALIALAVVALAIVFLLRTPPGHAAIARLIGALSGGSVRIVGLSGDLPNDVHASAVELRDAKGVWLRLRNVALNWSALSAANDHIRIHRVTVARVDLLRLPHSKETSHGKTPKIDVDALAIGRIEIARAVSGHAAVLTAHGSLHYKSAHRARADLVVARLDNADRYAVKGSINNDVVDGTASIDEGANGVLAALIGQPGLKPINLQARASGSRGANRVAFDLSAGALRASGEGTISLAARTMDVVFSAEAPAMRPNPDLAWASLNLQGRAQGSFDAPQVQARLRVADVRAGSSKIGALNALLRGDGGGLDLTGTANAVRVAGGDPDLFAAAPIVLSAHANLAAPSRPLRFRLSHPLVTIVGQANTRGRLTASAVVTVPSLAPFAALLGEDMHGSALFHLVAAQNAPRIALALNGTIHTQGASLAARMLGQSATLSLQASVTGGDVTSSTVSILGAGLTARASGSFENKNLRYSARIELPDLSRLTDTLKGSASLAATAMGPLATAQLHGAGSVEMASRGFARQHVGLVFQANGLTHPESAQLRAQGSFDDARLSLDAGLVPAGDGKGETAALAARWKSLNARANLQLPQASPVTGNVTANIGDLADFASLIGGKIAGAVNATVELKAYGAHSAAQVRAKISGLTLAASKVGAVTAQGAVRDPFAKPSFDLAAKVHNFQIGGLSGDANAKLSGPLDKLAIALNSVLRQGAQEPTHVVAGAVLDLPDRRVRIEKLTADWRKQAIVLDAPATVDFANGVAVDRLRLRIDGGGDVQIAGRLTPNLSASLSARDIPARMLQALAPSLLLQGTLSASAHVNGTLNAPQGTVALQGRGLALQGYSGAAPPASLDMRATLRGKTASLNASLTAGALAHLTLTGDAPLQPGNLRLHLGGTADLAMLNPVLAADGRQARGALAIDLDVTGTPSSPRAAGSVLLSKGAFRDYARGLSLHDIAATLRADGDVLHVTQLTARAGHGTIEGGGTVDLASAGMPVNIALKAKDARPIVSDLVTMTFSGDAALTGKLQGAMTLSGNLDVTHGEINLPDRFPPEVAVLDVRRRGQTPPPPAARESAIALDLKVATRGHIFVRGHGMDADLGGRIHLTGTTATPFATGGFRMNRGSFAMAGQTLDFTAGTVRFNGTGVRGRIDPALNFVAQTASGGITATLTVGGYASRPTIALASSPPLPQDEILARLLFQQSVKQLSPLQLAEIAQAIAALGGVGSGFNPLGALRKTLGLDRLSVGSTEGGATGNQQQTTVEAGKYIARNVYVGAKQNLSGGTQIQVQVNLTRRLKAQATLSTVTDATATKGSAAQDNGSSVGLSYQFEY